jgi:hypothetical protein
MGGSYVDGSRYLVSSRVFLQSAALAFSAGWLPSAHAGTATAVAPVVEVGVGETPAEGAGPDAPAPPSPWNADPTAPPIRTTEYPTTTRAVRATSRRSW